MRAIRQGELADRAFARLGAALPERDRAWLHELLYGTLRLRGRLDYVLEQFVRRGADSLDEDIHDILRLGTYQLLEMHSVPAYAAISQSVELAKSVRKRSASALVNGVLQSMARTRDQLGPGGRDVDRLVHWGSHPRWLVDRWIRRYGIEETARLVDANNLRPQLYVRPIGIRADEAIARAATAGVTLRAVEHVPDALEVIAGSIHDLLASAPLIVQDPAAGLVVRYAAAEGAVVADLCAAPGGKAIALANLVAGRGIVVAADIGMSRLERAVDNLRRLGRLPLHFVIADARRPPLASADVVLLDAPCTGTGTLRRHPDGKWRITLEDLRALVALQREMLDAAAAIVRAGGILVYATCSIEAEENQEQVNAFLNRHPHFRRRPPAAWPAPELLDAAGDLVVLPQRSGFDGSFAARLERVA